MQEKRGWLWASVVVINSACNDSAPTSKEGEVVHIPLERSEPSLEFVSVSWERGLTRRLTTGSAERYLILESVGTGCAFFDADGDGRLDIFLNNAGRISDGRIVHGAGTAYYRQQPSGTFEDKTRESDLFSLEWGTGVAVGDIDNDGDLDMFVACYGYNRLYTNEGDGTFREKSEQLGQTEEEFSTCAVFLDYDNDGSLDLYVANYVHLDLEAPPNGGKPCTQSGVPISCGPADHKARPDRLYRNVEGGRFVDVTERMGITDQGAKSYGLGVTAVDVNNDGWLDLYVANDTTPNFLWLNANGQRFDEDGVVRGAALDRDGRGLAGMGVDAADADGDGDFDLVVTNYSGQSFTYYRNLGDGHFEDASWDVGIAEPTVLSLGWGVEWMDADSDGDQDLIFANGHVHPQATQLEAASPFEQRLLVFRNNGGGEFQEQGERMGPAVTIPRAHRALASGDIDNDGDVDVLATVLDGPVVLLENRTEGQGNWLSLRLIGKECNREGIGARLELLAGGRRQVREVTRGGSYLSSNDGRVLFGIGEETSVERIEVRWPGGPEETFRVVGVNQEHVLTQGDGQNNGPKAPTCNR